MLFPCYPYKCLISIQRIFLTQIFILVFFFNVRPRAYHLLLVLYMGEVKDRSRLSKQVMWMCSFTNTCWMKQKQYHTVLSVWVQPSLPVSSPDTKEALRGCFILMPVICLIWEECVHLCPVYVCPPFVPLSRCVFCNMRNSGSELGAMTQEETGSPERGQQDAFTDTISTPADMDM